MHKTLKTKNKEVPRPFLLCFLLFFSFKLMVLGGGGWGVGGGCGCQALINFILLN